MLSIPSVIAVFALLGWLIFKLLKSGSRDRALPPGPPTVPILGNIPILPKDNTYLTFTDWAKQYGEIFSLKVGSGTTIVLSSLDAICEVLEKNGAITADRPRKISLSRIFGKEGSITICNYGPSWRARRRAAAEVLKPSACERHALIEAAEISQLVYDIHQNPEDFFKSIERSILSTIFSSVFGIRQPQVTSSLVSRYLRYSDMIFNIGEPGSVPPLEIFPVLQYLPDFMVKYWRARCDAIRREQRSLFFDLLQIADERQKNGMQNGCFQELLLERAPEWGLDREAIGYISGNFLSGATRQAITIGRWTILLSVCYPEAQRKVHEEMDRVIGSDKSPSLEDIEKLPYLQSFVKEVNRFRPCLPLSHPHEASEDLFYKGHLIPKGAALFQNTWAVCHDPDLFENPDEFDPDRYMRSPPYGLRKEAVERYDYEVLKKLDTIQFGAGRRICVGMDLANNLVEQLVANLLWAFTFEHAKDEHGADIIPNVWNFKSVSDHWMRYTQ
ncbi:hypothetical protein FRC03_004969 [Tulasnella sp. 419]|nr:hypothetical protein FRC03_004969 [Tulasnella sp. 419]